MSAESPITMGTEPTGAELSKARKQLQYEKIRLWSEMLYDKRLKPTHVRAGLAFTDLMTLDESVQGFWRTKKIVVWPSYGYISKKTGVGIQTVKTAIRQLESFDYLLRLEREKRDFGSNKYHIFAEHEREAARSSPRENNTEGGGEKLARGEEENYLGPPPKKAPRSLMGGNHA